MRRRRMATAAVAVTILGLAGAASPGNATTVKTGLARGQLARVVPYVGLPGVGAGVGVAQAEVNGPTARASAGLADFGALLLVLGQAADKAPIPLPALPSPITADSEGEQDVTRDPLLHQVDANTPEGTPPAPVLPAGAHEQAHAGKEPASRALVNGAGIDAGGLIGEAGGESVAEATTDATSSTVRIDRLTLGGGTAPAVTLSGLVWKAAQKTGEPAAASFSIAAADIAGTPVDLAGPDGLAGALTSLNDALLPAGLHLEAPETLIDPAGGSVSPLVLQVRNPETTAGLLAGVTAPATPVLNTVVDALLAAAPEDAQAARIVVNALLANGSGRSGGRLELGGASARVGSFDMVTPLPPAPPERPVAPSLPASVPALPAYTAPAADTTAAYTAPAYPAAGYPSASVPDYQASPSLPSASSPAGAAQGITEPAVPAGTLTAMPVRAPGRAPGGASAPLVLTLALVAVAILAAGDRLRLRRSAA